MLVEYAKAVYPRWLRATRPEDYLNGNPWQRTDDPQRSAFFDMFENDPLLSTLYPSPATDFQGRRGWCLTNSGGGSLFEGDFVSDALLSAWDDTWLNDGDVTLERFLRNVSQGHANLVRGLQGKKIDVKIRAGIGGLALPHGMPGIRLPQGEVRQLGESGKHWLATRSHELFDRGLSQPIELVFETSITTLLKVIAAPSDEGEARNTVEGGPWHERELLWQRLRFVLALVASHRVEEVWTHITYPVGDWNTLSRMSRLNPHTLSEVQARDWQQLTGTAFGRPLKHIDVTIDKLPLLLDGSTNPFDLLLNSVIVWENLFGSTVDASLRITAAAAWVLERETEKRVQRFKQLKEIYNLRSRVVHGAEPLHPKHFEQVFEARETTFALVREVLEHYPSLINLKSSSDRSQKILLAGEDCREG